MDKLISVIIPTYKRELRIVKRSVESALTQTYKNIEVIIVDDSPSDFIERQLIYKEFSNYSDSRVKYIQHPQNLGANVARNNGIKNASGYYFAFLDDDDVWLPTKLEKQVKLFDDSQVGLVYCKATRFNETSQKFSLNNLDVYEGFVFDKLMYLNFIGSNSFVMISRECLEKVGLFEESLLSSQDWELFLRIARDYKVAFVNEVLVIYFVHDGERITKNPLKQLQGWNYIVKKHEEYLKEHSTILNYWYYRMIPNYLRNRQYLKGSLLLIKLFFKAPIQTTLNLKSTFLKEKQSEEPIKVESEWLTMTKDREE